jgi:hypothetical protein
VAARWDLLNPRDPRLLALFQKLNSETELALRVALNRLSWKCRINDAWKSRIAELREAVIRDSDSLERVLRRAEVFERELQALG